MVILSVYNALNIPSQSNALVVGTGTGFAASSLNGSNGMDVAFATGAITLSNLRNISRYVVSTIAGETEFTSIQDAIDQAAADGASNRDPATVFVWEGSYMENLTLSPNVDIVGLSSNINILGSITYTSGEQATISNLNFTVPDLFGSEILIIDNSYLILNNVTIISLDSSSPAFSITNGSSLILKNECIIYSSYLSGVSFFCENSFISSYYSTIGSGDAEIFSIVNGGFYFEYSKFRGNLNLNNCQCSIYNSIISSQFETFSLSNSASVILINNSINCYAPSNYFITGSGNFIFSGLEFDNFSTARQIGPGITVTGQYRISSVIGNSGGSVGVSTENGELTLVGSGGITVTGSPSTNTLTISASGSGSISWQTISASQALSVNNGYFCISPGGAIALSLPTTSAVGDTIIVTLDGATSYTITQGANQQIRFGSQETTLGASGSLTTTSQGCTLSLVCSVANLRWNAISSEGTFTIV